MNVIIKEITLVPENNKRLISLCGPLDNNLKQLEKQLKIIIHRNGSIFKLQGFSLSVKIAVDVLVSLYSDTESNYGKINNICPKQVYLTIQNIQKSINQPKYLENTQHHFDFNKTKISLKKKTIKPRTLNQARYIFNIFNHDITFGVGPSGTGKTYLAIAVAVDLLERKKKEHIILSRPAIEAGEKLGFLPGNFHQKTDPYIQPLYDALYDILGYERMNQFIHKHVIEVIPLAYMRGRTLNDSVIILDESQNTTTTQMKMFLTRIGFNSTVIVNGDITQIDLPSHQESGLTHALKILSIIKDISFIFFNKEDSIRHSLITQIIDAYEKYEITDKTF